MDNHNCRNCGAPLNRFGDCDYCGTSDRIVSENADRRPMIEITADGIRFYA